MYKIVGSKEFFAIEIETIRDIPDLMGKIFVWIDNVRIGVAEEDNLILPHLNSLKLLLERVGDLTNQDFDSLPTEEIFKKVFNGSDIDHKHNFTLGEAFDDFDMIAYKVDQDIVLCVNLTEEPFFEYMDFPESPIRKSIPFGEFAGVIDQILQIG